MCCLEPARLIRWSKDAIYMKGFAYTFKFFQTKVFKFEACQYKSLVNSEMTTAFGGAKSM